MLLDDFDFALPEHLIAQSPAAQRDQSRLMLLSRGQDLPPAHAAFPAILDQLSSDDLLIMNNARVIPARLRAHKTTGGKVELLFISSTNEPLEIKNEFSNTNKSGVDVLHGGGSVLQSGQNSASEADDLPAGDHWLAMAKSSRSLKSGTILLLPGEHRAIVRERLENGQIRLQLDLAISGDGFFSYLDKHGEMPLPPYISPSEDIDHRDRYQTVYASVPGAIAAPTAGLHFTPALMEAIQEKGIKVAFVTLHVGLGTFLPVRVEHIKDHVMHEESFEIPEETVSLWQQTRARGGRIVSVGTTAMRALEAAASEDGVLKAGASQTSIFITPGYTFRAVDALLTNFHLPKSTLMMLVAAFHGHDRIMSAYREAVSEGYRFFSYGDAMFIG